ncbi:MAG: hypothetical protein C0505_10470 [Leptothrix sp. (in: Bacteria)]|nr:hypothetical protein [Leptothrix sp. (in: b-proteobacteria)]
MDTQAFIAGLLVAGCSGWVVWLLMPTVVRRRCRAGLGLKPATAAAQGGCAGCGGGCGGAAPAAGAPQVVKIVRPPGA